MALLKQSSRIKRFEYDDAAASEYHFFCCFYNSKSQPCFQVSPVKPHLHEQFFLDKFSLTSFP